VQQSGSSAAENILASLRSSSDSTDARDRDSFLHVRALVMPTSVLPAGGMQPFYGRAGHCRYADPEPSSGCEMSQQVSICCMAMLTVSIRDKGCVAGTDPEPSLVSTLIPNPRPDPASGSRPLHILCTDGLLSPPRAAEVGGEAVPARPAAAH